MRTTAALFLSTLAACGGARPEAPFERVLLLVTDATHAAHLSSYSEDAPETPSIDAIAAEGVRFSRAFSNNTWTLPSTASLMTGQLQETHGTVTEKHRLGPGAETLAELFRDAGYETAGFSQMPYASAEFGFDQGFDEFSYDPDTKPVILRSAHDWMQARPDGRWFVYLHIRRPHTPYLPSRKARALLEVGCPLADGSRDQELKHADVKAAQLDLTPEEIRHVVHLYRGNLITVDMHLTDLLESLREWGVLLAYVSDHGEALGQHGIWGHGEYLWAESIDIPMVFWFPGIEARVDSSPASTVDVFPTLLELCNLRSPGTADGASLAGRMRGTARDDAAPRMFTARYLEDEEPLVGVIEGDWKLLWNGPEDVGLYHRASDPGDTLDRSADEPEVTRRLSALAVEWRARNAGLAQRGLSGEEIDPEIQSDLRDIGYLGEDEDG